MKKFTQLNMHDPDNGVYGDCFRTCIACILGVTPEAVPHFIDNSNWDNPKDVLEKTNAWLHERGMHYIEIPFVIYSDKGIYEEDKITIKRLFDEYADWRDIYYIMLGKSNNNCGHCVIGLNGEIVHDPSVDKSGIVGPVTEAGDYWFGFLLNFHVSKA